MTRRETILAAGAFDPALKICEDWDLWQRIARCGTQFVPVGGLWVDVHVTEGSLSADIGRHFSDGLAVIKQGHSFDLRVVQPDPRHAAGAPTARLAEALWGHAIWLTGAAIGRGQDWLPMLEQLRESHAPEITDLHAAAAVLEDALVVGAGLPSAPWPGLWHQTESEIDTLLNWLEAASNQSISARQLRYFLENRILARLPASASARIGSLQRLAIDLAQPLTDMTLPGIRRLLCTMYLDNLPVGSFWCAPIDQVAAADLRNELFSRFDTPALRRRLLEKRALSDAADWIDTPAAIARLAPLASSDANLRTQDERIAAIIKEEKARAISDAEARNEKSGTLNNKTGPAHGEEVDYTDEAYWEGIFSAKDPWDYRNPYESVKYDQTIGLLDNRHFHCALEIACAEGEFTRRLSPLCDTILATDIAPSAVERAAAHLADLANVRCKRLDLLTDPLPSVYDLIVCSEVLYYLDDEAILSRFCTKVAECLLPGGWFVTAHAKLTVDEPDRTGFGWPHQFGATGIGRAFANTQGLVADAEFETPIYRIQRFRKLAEGEVEGPPRPSPRLGHAANPLPKRIAEMVKWRGGKEIPEAADWHDFPILMYHRIAEDGPAGLGQWRTSPQAFEDQLAWLAQNGWQGVSFERMTWTVHWGTALPPKSVMLTFDDATRDFQETALPLLHRYGFPATLFVPTGKVGATADWDAAHGDPAPILGWDEIAAIDKQDVTICSHGSTHVRLDMLGGEAILHELARSKAELEAALGADVRAIAYPFGGMDDAVVQLARAVGYDFGFTCFDGHVSRASNPLVLPRCEVKGGMSLSDFALLIGAGSDMPEQS